MHTPPSPHLAAARAALLRDIALLVGLCLLLIASGIGLRDPWPADEPRFALIARDMVASGNWLFPKVGGDLYADKPPLFFWLIAACYLLTGSLRVSFLLPSLLAGIGTVLLVYDLGGGCGIEKPALWAALILLFTVQFTLQARLAQIDATLCFWITLSLYGLLRHLLLRSGWGWYALGGFRCGTGRDHQGRRFSSPAGAYCRTCGRAGANGRCRTCRAVDALDVGASRVPGGNWIVARADAHRGRAERRSRAAYLSG